MERKKNKRGDFRGCYVRSLELRKKTSETLTGRKNGSPPKEVGEKISKSLKNSAKHKAHSKAMRGKKRPLCIGRKISKTRKLRGLKPEPTEFARKMKKALGKSWFLEYRISFGKGNGRGNFPADIANPELKIIIECDGKSHEHPKQKLRDRKRDKTAARQGWKVIRIKEKYL
ncbi:MAG: DUF559 domain-containing protein [Candidatus Omnitrophota bacterium]